MPFPKEITIHLLMTIERFYSYNKLHNGFNYALTDAYHNIVNLELYSRLFYS